MKLYKGIFRTLEEENSGLPPFHLETVKLADLKEALAGFGMTAVPTHGTPAITGHLAYVMDSYYNTPTAWADLLEAAQKD
jgi:hypothetical protein